VTLSGYESGLRRAELAIRGNQARAAQAIETQSRAWEAMGGVIALSTYTRARVNVDIGK
jgi:hypothetical protein